MNRQQDLHSRPSEQVLALSGGLLGVVSGLLIGALRLGVIGLQSGPTVPAEQSVAVLPGDLAFMLAYILPFILAVLVLPLPNPAARGAVWLGVAFLGILGSFTAFSGITLLLFPLPALLLGAAAMVALKSASFDQGGRLLVTLIGLVVLGSAAWLVLFSVESPQCWALVRAADGGAAWEVRPYGTPAPMVPAEPGPGDVIQWSCTSDMIAPVEAGLSLALWALAVAGLAWMWPHWRQALKVRIKPVLGGAE